MRLDLRLRIRIIRNHYARVPNRPTYAQPTTPNLFMNHSEVLPNLSNLDARARVATFLTQQSFENDSKVGQVGQYIRMTKEYYAQPSKSEVRRGWVVGRSRQPHELRPQSRFA